MTKRKSLSKRLRFEVFKRDKFTCQYCGKSAPDVVLEIDHIVPVSKGGTDDIMNLVTSCADCNRGKSNVELSDDAVIKAKKKQLDELAERREQIEMLYEWQKVLTDSTTEQIDKICDLIGDMTNYSLTDHGRDIIKTLITRFGYETVIDSTRTAFQRYRSSTEQEWDFAFNKIGGICWNKTHKSCVQCLNCNRRVNKWSVVCDYEPHVHIPAKDAESCPKFESRWS